MSTNDLSHFIWAVSVGADSWDEVAVSSTNLFGVREISRTGDVSGVNGVAGYDV